MQQRIAHVAGIRLAQQALAVTQMESIASQLITEEEKNQVRRRKVAIRHVIETGTIYGPILGLHKRERDREAAQMQREES
jgi:hypothetical protein